MFSQWRKTGACIAAAAALLYGAPGHAGALMWDFSKWNSAFNTVGSGNSLTLTASDGTTLTVTGWSDTGNSGAQSQVESAEMVWANSSALGTQNQAEGDYLPHSSVDSVTSDSDNEFDMLLLEFNTEVSLAGLDLNWATGGSRADTADISVLAWDGSGDGVIGGTAWADILAGNGGSYTSVGNYVDVDLSYFSLNSGSVASSKWLVGAYNPVFGAGGDAGNDGIALAALMTTSLDGDAASSADVAEVPLPGTLGLFLLGLALLRRRLARGG